MAKRRTIKKRSKASPEKRQNARKAAVSGSTRKSAAPKGSTRKPRKASPQPVSQDEDVFKCVLRDQYEWLNLPPGDSDKQRKGRYHQSSFPAVPDDRYVVAVWIDGNVDGLMLTHTDPNEIVQGFVDYLNKTPPRKKYAKKKPQPPYGNLELYKGFAPFKLREDKDGKTFVSALLTTDDPKNKNFWGTPPEHRRLK